MSSSRPNKLRRQPLFLRHIVGRSMQPRLHDGQVIVASGWFSALKPHDVVVIRHEGIEKIKRIDRIEGDHIFIVGDNTEFSTDSRQFGWVDTALVLGKVMWPRLRAEA